MFLFARLKLYAAGLLAFVVAMLGAIAAIRRDEKRKVEGKRDRQDMANYIDTRKEMDDARPVDSDPDASRKRLQQWSDDNS